MQCFHWTDEGSRTSIDDLGCDGRVTYRIGYRRSPEDDDVVLYIGPESTPRPMGLPPGLKSQNYTIQVVVQVVDEYGAKATVMYPVKVNLFMVGFTYLCGKCVHVCHLPTYSDRWYTS